MPAFGKVLQLDQKYAANHHNGIKSSEQNFQVLFGKVSILISAPHTVNQIRDDVIKHQDGHTGGIAEYLCQNFNTFGVIRAWNNCDDPNYNQDPVSVAYRDQIVELVNAHHIQWVIDLHGIMWRWKTDINLGVNDGQNISCGLDFIKELATSWSDDLIVKVDEPYKAASPWTVSSYVHNKTHVNCLQIELGPRIRTQKLEFGEFYTGFAKLIRTIESTIKML